MIAKLLNYIFLEKKKNIFVKKLQNISDHQCFENLQILLKKIFLDIGQEKNKTDKIIFFSPAAASFDNFKNFEDRGQYFNRLIKKQVNV